MILRTFRNCLRLLRSERYEETIAELLSSGQGVAFYEGCVHFDERLLQRAIVRRFAEPKQTIVIGSSTTMQLRSSCFPGASFYNHSLRRGVLEDYLAVYQLHRERNFRPASVVLGIDAWIWDPGHWKQYWWPLHRQYFQLTRDWSIDLHRHWYDPTSIRHCFRHLGYWLDSTWKGPQPASGPADGKRPFFYTTSEEFVEDYLKRPDGSVGYHAGFRNRGPAAVEQTILESKRFPPYQISPETRHAFELFVARLTKQGTRVVLFLPPHHPAVYELRGRNIRGEPVLNYDNHLRHLQAVESGVRSVARRHGCCVLGSFDPTACGCEKHDFYDWIHPNPTGIAKLLAAA